MRELVECRGQRQWQRGSARSIEAEHDRGPVVDVDGPPLLPLQDARGDQISLPGSKSIGADERMAHDIHRGAAGKLSFPFPVHRFTRESRLSLAAFMQPAQRLLAVVIAVAFLAVCSQRKGFDQMGLVVEEVGEVPVHFVARPPAHVGEITSWRTTFPGQVFAAVKTEAACPRDIHTLAGVQFKRDRIELCYTGTPRDEPVPGFPCSTEVYVKYEIMGVPADVEPTFVFVGTCLPAAAKQP